MTTTVLLYLATVFVWGTSWYAIKLQVGTDVAPEVSVAWRFALAALCQFAWALAVHRPLRMTWAQHRTVMPLAIFLFGANLMLIYYAETKLSSGLVAVTFSTITVLNIINGRLILQTRSTPIIWLSALLGLVGLGIVFRQDLMTLFGSATDNDALHGILLCLGGVYLASVGNVWAIKVQQAGISIIQANAWGMMYGAVLIFAVALLRGESLHIALTTPYVGALIYLTLFASIGGFSMYLTLLHRIGPERAGYVAVAFPVVALAMSAMLENFQITWETVIGGAIVLAGNFLVLRRPKA